MDENVAPLRTRPSMSLTVQSQISTMKPRSAIRRTRSSKGRSRKTISAHTARENIAYLRKRCADLDIGSGHPAVLRGISVATQGAHSADKPIRRSALFDRHVATQLKRKESRHEPTAPQHRRSHSHTVELCRNRPW